jgi:two-component system sensor histidine kinase VanS
MRRRGLSVRAKLTLSYAAVVVLTGTGLLVVVWLFLLRYVPTGPILGAVGFVPNKGDLVRAFAPRAAWAFALLVVFGLVGGWLLAGRMLAPLRQITRATRAASGGSLSHRIRMPGRQDEFRELADAFDEMLGRVEAHVDEQRRFAANASHELRTPLAVTSTILDVASRDPDADVPAALERLRQTNARAIALTEALLSLSRADRGPVETEHVDLSLAAEEAAETLLGLAEARGVELEVGGSAAIAIGSGALLGQLVTNLVHNAIVHNVPHGRVRVSTAADAAAALVVENTGPVVSEAMLATITEPFQRGTERTRGDGHDGAGLGLAIARRIVESHRGRLRIAAPLSGGLRVEVLLPRAWGGAASARSEQRGAAGAGPHPEAREPHLGDRVECGARARDVHRGIHRPPGRSGEPAADDDESGIHERRELEDRAAQRPGRGVERRPRRRVPGLGGAHDVEGRRARRRGSAQILPSLRDLRTADRGLEAAGLTARAADAVAGDREMSDLAGRAVRAAAHRSVHDVRARDARSEGDHEDVAAASARAQARLRDGRGLAVLHGTTGNAEHPREGLRGPGPVEPAHVGRTPHDARRGIEGARDRDGESRGRATRSVEEPADRRGELVEGSRWNCRLFHRLAVRRHEHELRVRTPVVDAERDHSAGPSSSRMAAASDSSAVA